MQSIRAKLRHPMLERAVGRLRASAAASAKGLTIDRAAECARSRAILALLEENEKLGREAIDILLEHVPATTWDLKAQDISRQIGLVMLSIGMTYDWCHPWLGNHGAVLIEQAYRLAGLLEVGYPPKGGGAVTGHAGEAMLFRDLLATGLAIYDQSPEMYDITAARILAEFVPARNFSYPSHMHHQGSAYGPYRYRFEVLAAWILERAGLGNPFVADQGQVPYRWIYTERPDGRLLAEGDVFGGRVTTAPYMFTAGLYKDSYLQAQFLAASDAFNQDPIEQLMFLDPALVPAKVSGLPLARYFGSPYSGMVVRSAWNGSGEDPAIVEFKVKEWQFNNHMHLDAGAFQIWYRGPLAMDTGSYRKYGSPHDTNYLKRTVAHNAVLVTEPGEVVTGARWNPDGGQRWPNERREPRTVDEMKARGYRVATTLGQAIQFREKTPEWAYLEGDLTEAYAAEKVELHHRAFVCLNQPVEGVECVLAVFDRLKTAKPKGPKRWLLHTAGKAEISDGGTRSGNGRASLLHQVLLPIRGEFRIESIGGPDSEFSVNGQNYPADRVPQPADEAGAWRVEVQATAERKDELFLNVLQVSADGKSPDPARALSTDSHSGFLLRDHLVLFSKDATRRDKPMEWNLPARPATYNCVVTGLAEGRWQIEAGNELKTFDVDQSSGIGSFRGASGTNRLRFVGAP